MRKDNPLYVKAKEEKKEMLIQSKQYKCFFCNKQLDVNATYSWHHSLNRIGELLYDIKYIFPVHNKCHVPEYHSLSVEQLFKTSWYGNFIERIKSLPKVYNKELNRLYKANWITIEEYNHKFIENGKN